ncbi:MAG: MoaD/ThiS family protein [Candidatus Latescibacterota bacterium]|nr:MoaD/ThiS family protein [Candidatus Latescibacterota bacterium]
MGTHGEMQSLERCLCPHFFIRSSKLDGTSFSQQNESRVSLWFIRRRRLPTLSFTSEQVSLNVKVLLFASCSDIVGSRNLDLEPASGTSVQDLIDGLIQKYPRFSGLERSIMISVNQVYVERDHVLTEGDEVAMIPPVSGG